MQPSRARSESWEEAAARLRETWEKRYGSSNARWEEYEPRYRYGWEMAQRPEYRQRSWSEVEDYLRGHWEQRYRDAPWDLAADSLRDMWDSLTGR
ncbi:MAG TPA: hypothetical protein VG370_30685 [Chloroflexota bacterium]|jgi:hypothetical protein|nr:hypothetical protein [Chloroflexota bacterium]